MSADRKHYALLAEILDHPNPDFPQRVAALRELLAGKYPEAYQHMLQFESMLPGDGGTFSIAEQEAQQELFVRTFQVQGITTMDVGYIAFGDDYKRAELMVNLVREHRDAGVDCGDELPDHLPNILKLLAVWEDEENVTEMVHELLLPAVNAMAFEFSQERTEARNKLYRKHHKTLIDASDNLVEMYRHPLCAVASVLKADFGINDTTERHLDSEFLRSLGRELDIEARGAGKRGIAKEA